MERCSYVYIMASRRNGTLYIGVTTNLISRVWQHKEKINDGFTKQYGITKLVYYEAFEHICEAIKHEKRLKKYMRKRKLELIEKINPNWDDLYYQICN